MSLCQDDIISLVEWDALRTFYLSTNGQDWDWVTHMVVLGISLVGLPITLVVHLTHGKELNALHYAVSQDAMFNQSV